MNLKSIVRHRINKPNTVVSRNHIEQNLNIALGNFSTPMYFIKVKFKVTTTDQISMFVKDQTTTKKRVDS